MNVANATLMKIDAVNATPTKQSDAANSTWNASRGDGKISNGAEADTQDETAFDSNVD